MIVIDDEAVIWSGKGSQAKLHTYRIYLQVAKDGTLSAGYWKHQGVPIRHKKTL